MDRATPARRAARCACRRGPTEPSICCSCGLSQPCWAYSATPVRTVLACRERATSASATTATNSGTHITR